jgi:hypothetical protein
MPWLVTTSAWPALAAQLAGVSARLVAEPAVVMAGSAGVAVGAGALVLCRRARPRARDRSA